MDKPQWDQFNSNLPKSTNLINGLFGEIYRKETQAQSTDSERNESVLFILILALFLVVVTEPLKLIMRRNIGKSAFSIYGALISAMFYIICASILFILLNSYPTEELEDKSIYLQYIFNNDILLSGAISYLILGIYIIFLSIQHSTTIKPGSITNYPDEYRGDSIFMQSKLSIGISQNDIWRRNEPLACFKVSFLLTILNPFVGFPILLTSVSFWLNEWFHIIHQPKIQSLDFEEMKRKAYAATMSYSRSNRKDLNGGPVS